jgi:hypothetical protein
MVCFTTNGGIVQERQKLEHLKSTMRYDGGVFPKGHKQAGKRAPIVGRYGKGCCPEQPCQTQRKAAKRARRAREAAE